MHWRYELNCNWERKERDGGGVAPLKRERRAEEIELNRGGHGYIFAWAGQCFFFHPPLSAMSCHPYFSRSY